MIQLSFNLRSFPRTIGRKEWREIWRWKRCTEKELAIHAKRQMEDFVTFGSTMPATTRADIMNKMVNPPILMHERSMDWHFHGGMVRK